MRYGKGLILKVIGPRVRGVRFAFGFYSTPWFLGLFIFCRPRYWLEAAYARAIGRHRRILGKAKARCPPEKRGGR
jgi:hypothetical protein